METLYELKEKYKLVADMMNDIDVDEQTILDTLESIGDEIEEKADNYAKIIQSSKGMVTALESEIKRLTERKTAVSNKIDRLKKFLEESMIETGKTKFKTNLFSFGIQKNPPSVQITEGTVLPDKYYIPQEPKTDKKSLIADIKAGAEIKGVKLIQTESLRIR